MPEKKHRKKHDNGRRLKDRRRLRLYKKKPQVKPRGF